MGRPIQPETPNLCPKWRFLVGSGRHLSIQIKHEKPKRQSVRTSGLTLLPAGLTPFDERRAFAGGPSRWVVLSSIRTGRRSFGRPVMQAGGQGQAGTAGDRAKGSPLAGAEEGGGAGAGQYPSRVGLSVGPVVAGTADFAVSDGFRATNSGLSYQGHSATVMVKKQSHACNGSGSAVNTFCGQGALSDLSGPKRFTSI